MGGLLSLPEREAVRSLRSIVRSQPLDKPVLSDVLAPLGEALGLGCGHALVYEDREATCRAARHLLERHG